MKIILLESLPWYARLLLWFRPTHTTVWRDGRRYRVKRWGDGWVKYGVETEGRDKP